MELIPNNHFLDVFFFSYFCCFMADNLNLNQFYIVGRKSKVTSVLWSDCTWGCTKCYAVLWSDCPWGCTKCCAVLWERIAEVGASCGGIGLPETGSGRIWIDLKWGWMSTAAWRSWVLQFSLQLIYCVVMWNNFSRGFSAVELDCLTWLWQIDTALLALPGVFSETWVVKLVMTRWGVWVDWHEV